MGIDVRRAICPIVRLQRSGGEFFSVRLRYECLPSVCFLYGMLTHRERFFPLLLQGVTIR